MKLILSKLLILPLLLFSLSVSVQAEAQLLKPFFLGSQSAGNYEKRIMEVKQALTHADFEIVGEYSPYKGTTIIVITNDAMQAVAAKTTYGGFGAMQRISVVAINDKIQVSYTNPIYMSHAYQMDGDLREIADQLEKSIGKINTFGPEEGLDASDLREYHYKIFMPYFEDIIELAEYASYQEAVQALEKGLADKKGGVSKVYRIDISGKETSVFGVSMTEKVSSDKYIMSEIDFKSLRSAAHLPYEILISQGKIIALSVEFRIAINFPDLAMMGDNSFINIMDAPGDIEEALKSAAGVDDD